MKWNSNLYDQKHDFVSKYGEDLIQLLAPEEGEDILDLGCGTGDLAEAISKYKANVVGIDSSEEMVLKAREKYPHIEFIVANAENFSVKKQFDAVFSNAALHWVLEPDRAADCIFNNLKKGGRFVAEFGGKGNVKNIRDALKNSLNKHGYTDKASKSVWYFPSLSEYASLLENKGFRVTWAAHFDRDTLLQDMDGIKNWLYMFGNSFLQGLSDDITRRILTEVEEQVRPTNFKNNQWYADYVRLRILAIK